MHSTSSYLPSLSHIDLYGSFDSPFVALHEERHLVELWEQKRHFSPSRGSLIRNNKYLNGNTNQPREISREDSCFAEKKTLGVTLTCE